MSSSLDYKKARGATIVKGVSMDTCGAFTLYNRGNTSYTSTANDGNNQKHIPYPQAKYMTQNTNRPHSTNAVYLFLLGNFYQLRR